MANTTITDTPRRGATEQDRFGIIAYERGLEEFLRGASTPITIALQGEWGSGKTSLMNVLRDELCGTGNNDGEYFSVWINTWEYSLMRNSNEALLQILFKMASEVVTLSKTEREEALENVKKSLMGFGSIALRNIANKAIDGLGDGIVDALSKEAENNIADLREKLQAQIKKCMEKNPEKKGIIFFIDDLDRIDPPMAVELLELLKNIFTLENCIFVLAIDYDVVIKGLKPKFGELNEKNEREFRSFFDKIIQVPFSMPVSQYSTKEYLIEELKRIGVLDSSDLSDNSLINKLDKVETLTVGPNPRSIKRFLNTLSLIKCINNAKNQLDASVGYAPEKEEGAVRKLNIVLNLAIVGIQVAYPKVYSLLCIEPGFTMWNDTIAAKMGIPAIDGQTKDRLADFDEFDEIWEQVLYRLCSTDRYLKNNAINISQLFNLLRSEIRNAIALTSDDANADDANYEDNAIKEYMQYQMSQAAITGFSAGDTAPLSYNPGQLMRDVQWRLCQYVSNIWKDVRFYVPKVKYNGGVRTDGNYPDLQIWQNQPSNHKIRFQFRITTKQILQEKHPEFMPPTPVNGYQQDDISTLTDIDLSLFANLLKFQKTIASNDCYNLWAERRILTNGKLLFQLNFDVTFDNAEAFLEARSIKTMQEVTHIFFDIIFKFHKMQ